MGVALARIGTCAVVAIGSTLCAALQCLAQAREWREVPELMALHAERGRAVFQRKDGTLVSLSVGSVDAESGLLLRQVGEHVALLIQQAATDPEFTRRIRIELTDGAPEVLILEQSQPEALAAEAQIWVIRAVEAP